jgi:glycine/D-amino acid oxidase-like deaminating enzyme
MSPSPPSTLWSATVGGDAPRYDDPATGDVDVAIVGAGYTGLWTALSLVRADPALRVLVVDQSSVGFGASGRNGGWCSALLPIGLATLASRHGRDAAIALQRAMFDTVGEVGRLATESGASFHRGGTITLAHDPYQRRRIEGHAAELREFGFGDGDGRLLTTDEASAQCRASAIAGAFFVPHCAAVHPLQLARAVAAEAARHGVRIAEGTTVHDVGPRCVVTDRGTVRADVVVLATEAYTSQLPGRRREVLPIYSMMIGSEPLSATQWAEIGLADRPTFTSATNMIIYGQRTADGRVAFGGRGAPYHFGSRIDERLDTDERVRERLLSTIRWLFPPLRDVEFPFHWGGPLGVPRDWHPHATYDRSTGIASAGGYAGDGVATANLAGRILADLILGRDTDITRLPIAGHRSRRWEPEPLRWMGVRLGATAASRADTAESSTGPLAPVRARAWSRVFATLTGH